MSLHVSYRPKKLKKIIGNAKVKKSLKGLLKRDQVPSTFLFTGPSGCGKTTFARALAYELGCAVNSADYKELNTADDRGIDSIRALREGLKYQPISGDIKFILLDEAHMITAAAQEALLKILEEPPSHVHIALCTTNPEKLKTTLKRRCHHYTVTALTTDEINELIKRVLTKEGINYKKFPNKVIEKIDELADGSPGQALKLLDQVLDMNDEKEAIAILQSTGASITEVLDLCRLLVDDKLGQGAKWGKFFDYMENFYSDAEGARFAILGYLATVLLNNPSKEISRIMDCYQVSFYYTGRAGLVNATFKAIFKEKSEMDRLIKVLSKIANE